jgi:hypothetical protein
VVQTEGTPELGARLTALSPSRETRLWFGLKKLKKKKKIEIRRRLKCTDERKEKRKMREGRVVALKCGSGGAVERGKEKKKKKKEKIGRVEEKEGKDNKRKKRMSGGE